MAFNLKVEEDNAMAALFERAEREKLWFFQRYTGIWFTPKQLRAAQADGRFRWGSCNWELHDPNARLSDLCRKMTEATAEYERVKALIDAEQGK